MLSANTTGAMSFDQNIQQAMGAKNARLAVIQMIKQLRIELDIADKEIDVEGVQSSAIPAQFYDPISGKGWSGNGSVPKVFKEARNFDKANPTARPKQMEQYLIPDGVQGQSIALKLKKDVRTMSGQVIKYADLITEASTQSLVSFNA
ncbi:H-NS histone family [Comamonas aquatica]|uniref:hypothetical protein n=1 Tax=Comamonas aquatica TaxID=225991 RepID=UPI001EF298AE|nr:hypothetical protein [Comamonas aquatica]CAB5654346.1 H-NS histone family [Comamonas aquatica]CAC9184091.1 H-NS histone family [Comamonas aquatica]